ncbi:MAG TPA: 2,3-bisphosphoglycerate-independent phosphoglycerate mutase, partial [Tepidisphaeraceae bacterium]|nr:2,3-bisphosphoglycerate-independent phosphoglycerate mutase [Tepidisphaeraceae bacterium]
MSSKRPLAIIIRDGWGKNPYPEQNKTNAVFLAHTPVDDAITRDYPSTLVKTSGFDVGLPEGTMGNSEVGHQNIGAGRIVDQESVRITKQARADEFVHNAVLLEAVDRAKQGSRALHLMGIASDAGVHGLLDHLYALLRLAKARGVERVFLHAFTDGRDTAPTSGLSYIAQIEQKMCEIGVGKIASVSGRYWAMDRDDRWPRVERAYRAIVDGAGPFVKSASEAIKFYYEHPVESNLSGDEFVTPSVVVDAQNNPIGTIKEDDSVIFYNYRGDRPRELTKAFVIDPFSGFGRQKLDLHFVTMTAYEEGLPVRVAYPKPGKMNNILGEYLSNLGLKQFRCAETEKFPHVTFFFNDYREQPFPGEDRVLCPSRKDVATYDLVPDMSAGAITDATMKAIESGQYDLLVINYANGDMV